MAGLLLVACDTARDAIYQSKAAPDEFAVYTRAPLSLPPEYSLRPPSPGSAPRNSLDPQGSAEKAVFGKAAEERSTPPSGASGGVIAILERTGALNAPENIRQEVDRETSILLQDDERLTDTIMFWRSEEPFGTVVDPTKEQARLQENQALGKPLNEGDVPIIERRKKSTLDKLF